MPLSRRLSAYSDVQAIFDERLKASSDLFFVCETPNAAIAWRQRAYYFRKLMHDWQTKDFDLPEGQSATPYDRITLVIDKENPTRVRITYLAIEGKLMSSDGEEIILNLDIVDETAEDEPLTGPEELLSHKGGEIAMDNIDFSSLGKKPRG